MTQEIELKLCLTAQGMQLLQQDWLGRQAPQRTGSVHLANTYFDTSTRDLHRKAVALRLRERDGEFIQTLKTRGESRGGLHQRGEWEWQVAEPRLYPELLRDTAFPQELLSAEMVPLFRTDFQRTEVVLRRGEAVIELALDEGQVLAGDKRMPLLEVELELKQGPVAALMALAQELAESVPVWPSDISKAERGYRLGLGIGLAEAERKSKLEPAHLWAIRLYKCWLRQMEAFRAEPGFRSLVQLLESLSALAETLSGLDGCLPETIRDRVPSAELQEELDWLRGLLENLQDRGAMAVLAEFESSRRAGRIALALSRLWAEG